MIPPLRRLLKKSKEILNHFHEAYMDIININVKPPYKVYIDKKVLEKTPLYIKEAIKEAAAGVGSPLKYLEPIVSFCTLNRASRNAPHTTYVKLASQPSRPKGARANWNASMAGAIPNATRSDRESYSVPKSLVVLV